jgi:hypothetical protein
MTTMALGLGFVGKLEIPAEILAGLCVLKNTDPELFIKAKMGQLTFDEVRTKFAFQVAPEDAFAQAVSYASDIWMYCLGVPAQDDRQRKRYDEIGRWFRGSGPELILWVANDVVDRLQPLR